MYLLKKYNQTQNLQYLEKLLELQAYTLIL